MHYNESEELETVLDSLKITFGLVIGPLRTVLLSIEGSTAKILRNHGKVVALTHGLTIRDSH